MKAVVVLNGQTIGDETETGEETTDNNTEEEVVGQDGVEDQGTENTDETPVENPTERAAPNVAGIKEMVGAITKGLKETLPKHIVPKIKMKAVEAADHETVEQLLVQFDKFLETFDQAPTPIKTKLQKMQGIVQQQYPQVQKILAAIKKILGTTSETADSDTVNTPENQALLKEIEDLLNSVRSSVQEAENERKRLEKELEASPVLEGGSDFLNSIF